MSEHLDVQLAHRLLNDEFDPQTCARWLRHVDQCPRCHDLLANERALRAVLGLGDEPTPAPGNERLGRLAERVADFTSADAPLRRRRRVALLTGLLLANAGLAVLLTWQLEHRSTRPESVAAALRISPALQAKVITNLDPLTTLAKEPWLVDRYEVVRTLEELIEGSQPQ